MSIAGVLEFFLDEFLALFQILKIKTKAKISICKEN